MHALRMMHDIAAKGFEVGGNKFANQYGYDITGFSDNLKEPIVSEAVNQCLEEIALENADILEYVKSPYARLGLAWAGCLATCAKKKKFCPGIGRFSRLPHHYSDMAACHAETHAGRSKSAHGSGPSRAGLIN